MFVPDGERVAIIIRQALPLSRWVMKQTWKKVKIVRGTSLPTSTRRSSKVRYYIGWDIVKMKKQNKVKTFAPLGNQLLCLWFCSVLFGRNVRSCWCLEGVCATNLELCLAHCTLPHQTPGDTDVSMRMPDVLTNYFFSQVSCFLPVGRLRPAPSWWL